MTQTMINNFKIIIEATEDLFDNFDKMAEAKMTPKDFGLSVMQHPDSGLQVTARNKLKSSQDYYFEMKDETVMPKRQVGSAKIGKTTEKRAVG